ncbi:MAG: N-acetyltransferase family protein [Actinomycetes bacterium]
MNSLIAPFAPDAHGVPLPDAVVRLADRVDLCRTGALSAQREGGDPAEWTAQHERRFDDERHTLVVAEYRGEIIGYGWLSWLTPTADGGRNAPDGWYLSGVVVSPDFRRRGLGRRLTQARIEWALAHGGAVHYVVAARNHASRTLHSSLGFQEITTDFTLPGVVFGNNDGILCRLLARPDAEVVDLATRRS